MSDQIIVTVSHQYGSGGRDVSRLLAEKLGVTYYDSNILIEIARQKGVDPEPLKFYDQKPIKALFTRSVRGHSSSPQKTVVNLQSDFIRDCAANGESFVAVGRGFESLFTNEDPAIRIFILADIKSRIQRVMKKENLDKEAAVSFLQRENKKRTEYFKSFMNIKWGDPRNYDICISSSVLGIEGTTDFLYDFIKSSVKE